MKKIITLITCLIVAIGYCGYHVWSFWTNVVLIQKNQDLLTSVNAVLALKILILCLVVRLFTKHLIETIKANRATVHNPNI